MSGRRKIDPVLKVELVEKYLKGEIGIYEAAKLAGMSEKTVAPIRRWINIYEVEGPTGLLDQTKNRHYPAELKLDAVNAYLNGEGTLGEIAKRFKLRSETQLIRWTNSYNTHGEIKNRGSGRGSYMRKARKTTYEERLEIVQHCLGDDKNYGASAKKYNCSYQQVYNWVKRYESMGAAGLEDRRGKRAGTQPSRTKEEELRDKIAIFR